MTGTEWLVMQPNDLDTSDDDGPSTSPPDNAWPPTCDGHDNAGSTTTKASVATAVERRSFTVNICLDFVLAFFIPLASVFLYAAIGECFYSWFGVNIDNPVHLPGFYQCGSVPEYILVTFFRLDNVVAYLPWLILAVRIRGRYPGLALGLVLGTGINVWSMITNIVFFYHATKAALTMVQ